MKLADALAERSDCKKTRRDQKTPGKFGASTRAKSRLKIRANCFRRRIGSMRDCSNSSAPSIALIHGRRSTMSARSRMQ
jgi:hypothetical protein